MNGWTWNPNKRKFKTIKVSRLTKSELKQAISDLEERGFRVLKQNRTFAILKKEEAV